MSPVKRGPLRGLIYVALLEAVLPFTAIRWAPIGWVVVGYAVLGSALSAFAERVLRGHYAEAAAALDELSVAEQTEAARAMWRGPLPVEPRIGRATALLVALELDRAHLRLAAAIVLPLYALRWTATALDDTPRAWVPVVAFFVATVGVVVLHWSLRRRLRELDPDEASASN